MKTLHNCLSLLMISMLMVCGFTASAQMIKDPTDWSFTAKKLTAGTYALTIDASIKAKWHIYGISPGGEGELIGTSFQFDNGSAKVKGEVKEVTPAVQTTMLDEKVNLHSGKATFKVNVVGKTGQMISGTVEYQACNDQMCLPPKKQKFSVKLP